MDLVNVRDLFRNQEQYAEQVVTIGGWVRNIRNSKNFGFIVVNDGTFFEPVQVVYSDVLSNFEEVEKLDFEVYGLVFETEDLANLLFESLEEYVHGIAINPFNDNSAEIPLETLFTLFDLLDEDLLEEASNLEHNHEEHNHDH